MMTYTPQTMISGLGQECYQIFPPNSVEVLNNAVYYNSTPCTYFVFLRSSHDKLAETPCNIIYRQYAQAWIILSNKNV